VAIARSISRDAAAPLTWRGGKHSGKQMVCAQCKQWAATVVVETTLHTLTPFCTCSLCGPIHESRAGKIEPAGQ